MWREIPTNRDRDVDRGYPVFTIDAFFRDNARETHVRDSKNNYVCEYCTRNRAPLGSIKFIRSNCIQQRRIHSVILCTLSLLYLLYFCIRIILYIVARKIPIKIVRKSIEQSEQSKSKRSKLYFYTFLFLNNEIKITRVLVQRKDWIDAKN